VKIAAYFGEETVRTSATLECMLAAQASRAWHEPIRLTASAGALGAVRTSDRFSHVPSIYQGRCARIVVSGVPISLSAPVDERLQQAAEMDFEDAIRELQLLDGAFALVMWNEAARKLAVITDLQGMQPLYMHRRKGTVAFASQISALTGSGVVDYEPDPAAWGAFLAFGHTIADRTLANGVTRVPAASVIIYAPDSDLLTCRPYWHWPEPLSPQDVDDRMLDDIADLFIAELQAYLAHHLDPVVWLSGGYDSRLILAALAEIGHRARALTLSHPDELLDLDGKLARRIAREFGVSTVTKQPASDFFSSELYVRHVTDSELASPSLQLFIAQLVACLEGGTEAIWDGMFPGCNLFPVHQHPGGFTLYLHYAASGDRLRQAAEQLFRREFVEQMYATFTEALDNERARYPDDELGVSQFVVRNRTRHRIANNSLQAFSNDVLALTPGTSRQFWTLAAAIPIETKKDHRLYQRLFRRRFARALRVPAVSAQTIDPFGRPFDPDVLMARAAAFVQRRPRICSSLARFGVSNLQMFWKPSACVDSAVRSWEYDDGYVNGEAVARLRTAVPPFNPAIKSQRELLFYWHMSRQIFGGTARTPSASSSGGTAAIA
jgi:hypothetical protein